MPLSYGSVAEDLKKIWHDREIKSLRVQHGDRIPLGRRGTPKAEVILGTDNDVFLFVGSVRYDVATCGILFSHQLERSFPRQMSATPFDSGGLVSELLQKRSPVPPREYFGANLFPVPDYRSFLGEFIATLFDPPEGYFLSENQADCQVPIGISGGDVRRHTFEVRFADRLPLDAHILAIFLPKVLAQEDWAHDIDEECTRRRIDLRLFGTKDNQAYDELLEATKAFVADICRPEAA